MPPNIRWRSRRRREIAQLSAFLDECKHGGVSEAELETQEKKGRATGLFALHPITGEQIPIWVANFVLMGYGTGAVMAVPGHDQRDFEFAHKYSLPIKQVIALRTPLPPHLAPDFAYDANEWKDWYADKTRPELIVVNSGEIDGMGFRQAFDFLAEKLQREGKGARRVNFRLRDWGVSRQRYWGCPIPIVYCDKCDAVPVPESQLPVVLPEDVAFTGMKSPIKADPEWRKTTCPNCGGPAERETDTFDTFMESSWYYARYTSPGASDLVDERANYWLPVDQYIGGIEHAIMHLMYFRFYHKLMRDAGLVKSDEPATNLLCQGMVIADTFYREGDNGAKDWHQPRRRRRATRREGPHAGRDLACRRTAGADRRHREDVEVEEQRRRSADDGGSLRRGYRAPVLDVRRAAGAVAGLERIRRGGHVALPAPPVGAGQQARGPGPTARRSTFPRCRLPRKTLRRQLHETIQKVGDDYGRRLHLQHRHRRGDGTAESPRRSSTTCPRTRRALRQEAFEAVALLLNPITPHTAHALWQTLGHAETTAGKSAFPKADPDALVRDADHAGRAGQRQAARHDRGRVRRGARGYREAALADPNVVKFVDGLTVRKVIVVPGKIVNIVVA